MELSAWFGSVRARLYPRCLPRILAALALWCFWVSAPADDLKENRFDAIIHEIAISHRVDPFLIKAMIWHESRFNPLARGKAGEIGLMQIKMDVVRDWAKARGVNVPPREEIFDPYVNIEIGTWYFARAFRKWSFSTVEPPVPKLAETLCGRRKSCQEDCWKIVCCQVGEWKVFL